MTDARFRRAFGEQFFDRYWQLHADWAIQIGYYKYADRLTPPDAAARNETLAQLDEWLAELRAIDPASLSPEIRADRAMLENEFLAERWQLTELRAWQWNPSVYNVAEPFALLRDLTFAPLDERLRIFSRRLTRVPAYYAAAKANIERPTREHTELAIEQNRGALSVFGPDLEQTLEMSGLSAAERAAFNEHLGAARAAIEDFARWLEELRQRLAAGTVAARPFRLGRELYAPKFAYEIQSGDTAEALYERAVAEKDALHKRMATLAELLWPKYFPNEAAPADALVMIARLIERLADDHVAPAELVREIERQIPELERFVREHDLLDLDES